MSPDLEEIRKTLVRALKEASFGPLDGENDLKTISVLRRKLISLYVSVAGAIDYKPDEEEPDDK